LLLAGLAVLGLTAGDENDPGGESRQQTEESEAERAERRERRERRRRRAAAAEGVRLRVVPTGATYVCVDDGKGNVRFEGTLSDARTFRGRRVRILLGRRAVQLSANGKRVPIEPGAEPIALDFSGGRQRELPESRAPCA
jgi:hypothetical protein